MTYTSTGRWTGHLRRTLVGLHTPLHDTPSRYRPAPRLYQRLAEHDYYVERTQMARDVHPVNFSLSAMKVRGRSA